MIDVLRFPLAILTVALTVVAVRQAAREFRLFLWGRGKDLLHGVEDKDLKLVSVEWPLGPRWPRPSAVVDSTDDREAALPRLQVLARLAARASSRCNLLGQGLVLAGSAWLGSSWSTLAGFVVFDYTKIQHRSASDFFGAFLPLLLVTVGLLLVGETAGRYRTAKEIYEAAAARPNAPVTPLSTRPTWRQWLRARLGSGVGR